MYVTLHHVVQTLLGHRAPEQYSKTGVGVLVNCIIVSSSNPLVARQEKRFNVEVDEFV